ncbi:xanthine phosphoribosyltransferase [Peptostreptococcus equinus]|uniref:Xanthine phosphoribosyltransferase n=1 Tax=Peptostreptococcus equinus TaxID=3003601 RepID=A0ABY7JL29_9FIRM|nr:xanthine phosphoribosyltransferase [Peptostreptococcus sp. CBA3647]WAW14022.1 xanthine phosphoribosyltransferase [Peptostreptococcus sp. CBA3647]
MEVLKNRILIDGTVNQNNILKVDNFLNHQIDVGLLNQIGLEFKKRFSDINVDKIITIESSGIAIATITAQYFDNIPVIFAKKTKSRNLDEALYHTKVYSSSKNQDYDLMISKRYLKKGDKVIIIDDFLAKGSSVMGLMNIIKEAQVELIGVGIVIEKSYEYASMKLKEQDIRVESLACIESLENKTIRFK